MRVFTFFGAKKEAKKLFFIHSFVPSVESGKAERSGAENEPFYLTFFGAKNEPRNILCPFSLAQRKERKDNFVPYFLWRKERSKETSTPTKSPPILGDLTEEWQKPLILRSFWYRGTRDEFLNRLAHSERPFNYIDCRFVRRIAITVKE